MSTPTTLSAEYAYNVALSMVTVGQTPTSIVFTMLYRKDVTVNVGGAIVDQVASVPASVSVDLVANAANTLCTVNAVAYTGAQITAILAAMAAQARAAQGGPF